VATTGETGATTSATRTALFHGASAAVVAVFCYGTASRIPWLHEAYWAPIAAVVVMYPEREATVQAGLQRLVGTAVGSAIGWASAAWWQGNVLLYGAAILVAVALCHALRLPAAARLCAVAVTVITIIPHPEPPGLVALYRFIEVSYGVACAVAYMGLAELVAHLRRRSTLR
jgi:uncharacterized membrane protein YgaE (UPF0421/DUF939 family)